jgi:hypothetical protein
LFSSKIVFLWTSSFVERAHFNKAVFEMQFKNEKEAAGLSRRHFTPYRVSF